MSPTASTSALPPVESHDTDKISAYYSLAFPNFTYYLQTLTVTIGRRPIPSPCAPATASTSISTSTTTASDAALVDVDLGPLKSVSRLHARIEYEEEEERFILVVLGRNGAWVDGIWAGCGSKVPLGARSQIQIATRTFHFILPPPQEPDPTSPSPPPSTARQRSPSLDITSLSPASSRLVSPQPTPPAAAAPDKAPKASTSKPAKTTKKRKRVDHNPPPLRENMPPKPLATYAVMCYRAITSLGGKATLQDVIQWMIDKYEWYRLNVGGPWENSIRHNLSSNRAFRNVARSPDEKGKGFLWGIDPKSEPGLREADAKARQAELDRQQGQNNSSTAAPPVIPAPKVQPLPVKPAFTTEPLKSANVKERSTVGRKPPLLKTPKPPPVNGQATNHTATPSAVAPPAPANVNTTVSSSSVPMSPLPDTPATVSAPSSLPPPPPSSGMLQLPSNVTLPIIVAPLPDSHPLSSASAAALNSASPASALLTVPPIALHSGTLILNPTVFGHLTPERLKQLEGLGAQKALEILQGDIVQFLKEKMRGEGTGRGKGRWRGRGRGGRGGKGGRKEGETRASVEEANSGHSVTKGEEGHGEEGAPTSEENKSSFQSLSRNPANEPHQTSDADGGFEERAVKKRKMDPDVDVDVDVIGP